MAFWIFAIFILISLVVIATSSTGNDPLGGDGGSGCFPLGCFVRLAIFIFMLVLMIMAYQLLKGFV